MIHILILFAEEFTEDLPAVIERAKAAGVSKVLMPNIDDTILGCAWISYVLLLSHRRHNGANVAVLPLPFVDSEAVS